MRVFISFAPFIAFAVLLNFMSIVGACAIAAAIALVAVLRDYRGGRSIKIMEAGSLVLYGGLAIATGLLGFDGPLWAIWEVNNAGLLLIALGSLAIGLPFTLQYAREEVAPELWGNPVFLSVNRRITAAWAAAFAVMLVAQLPEVPSTAGTVVTILALVAAWKFTKWYPPHVRQARMSAPAE